MIRFFYPPLLVALAWLLLWGLAGCSTDQTALSSATEPTRPASSTVAPPTMETPAQSSSTATPTTSMPPISAVPPVATEPPSPPSDSLPATNDAPASTAEPASASSKDKEESSMVGITLQIGNEQFTATLADNDAARAFARHLPMTVEMAELNGQEKLYHLPENLSNSPTERPSTIHRGDIMCWSGNTLVLFYATFSNSYGGYQRLGTVDNPEGLARALGDGSVEVAWSLAA